MLKIIPQKKKSTIAVEDRKRLVLYEQIEKKIKIKHTNRH